MWLFPQCLNVMGLRPLVGRWTRSIELVLFRSLCSLRSRHCAPLVTFICLVLACTLSGVPQLRLLGGIFQDQFHVWTMCEPVNTFTGNRREQYTTYQKFGFQLWGMNISTLPFQNLISNCEVLGVGIWQAGGRLRVGLATEKKFAVPKMLCFISWNTCTGTGEGVLCMIIHFIKILHCILYKRPCI